VREEGTCDSLLTTRDRAIIETDTLDDSTIAAIDRLIRERTGGASSILRVAKPRQKLEDLFIAIVERARAEKISTSGAQHGGQTAAFLRGEGEDQGESLIDRLVEAGEYSEPAPVAREAEAPIPARADEPDVDVLNELLAQAYPEQPQAPAAPAAPAPVMQPGSGVSEDVDLGVIGSLLDDDAGGTPGSEPRGKRGRKP
jgi:hypothetical protein